MNDKKALGIYIHIPFCVRKCLYCDFLSDVADSSVINDYIEAVKKEISYTALDCVDFNSQFEVKTIFFGGGTPSLIKSDHISRILDKVRERFDVSEEAEITIECNPATADLLKMKDWIKSGVNRLSIGLQSSIDGELKLLGRVHDKEQFEETYKNAIEAGFENINIDIMSALPGQTPESYRKTLEYVVASKPKHISAYSLIVEPDTPFYEIYGEGKTACADFGGNETGEKRVWPDLPDEDTEREMYYLTEELLAEHGYERYEISNYSKKGYECRHNISYWDGTDYIGFGVGAASYLNGIRYSNTSDIYTYINACMQLDRIREADAFDMYTEDEEMSFDPCSYLTDEKYHEQIHKLSLQEKMEEFMFLGLRMMKGISKSEFKKRFLKDIRDVYPQIPDKLIKQDLLIEEGDSFRLTKTGIDVSNVVLANFLL